MEKKKLLFATGNQGKVNEIRQILGDHYEVYSMKELGVRVNIVEDGKTFEENAVIKARAVMEATGDMTLADDTGFEVDCLGGEPGIYSARYMGEDTSYDIKNAELIRRCEGVPDEGGVDNIAIAPPFRRQAVGRALMVGSRIVGGCP